jgi:hypothetical protein
MADVSPARKPWVNPVLRSPGAPEARHSFMISTVCLTRRPAEAYPALPRLGSRLAGGPPGPGK